MKGWIALGLVVAGFFLSGCVSESTDLRNAQGQTTKCENWGFGFIGAPVAMAQHDSCVKKAHAAGYTEGGPPPAAAAK